MPSPRSRTLGGPFELALAKAVPAVPNRVGTQFESKFDGFRVALVVEDGGVTLFSRNGTDLTTRFPELSMAAEQVPDGCVLDGEAVIWGGDRLDFDALQRRMGAGAATARRLAAEQPASFVAFDVLAVLGRDVRGMPLSDRRRLLEELAAGFAPPLELSPATTDRAEAMRWWDELAHAGIEGIIVNSLLNERVDAVQEGRRSVQGWRVYWVPARGSVESMRLPDLRDWDELAEDEARSGVRPGTPIMLSPHCGVDGRLACFLVRSSFARLERETKRNYTADYCIFFDFLWNRGKDWDEASPDDLWDFEDWRTRSLSNPQRVGGSRWNRGLAALGRLYSWAVRQGHVPVSPIETREAVGRRGRVAVVPAARAKDAKATDVHWLTPRMFRRWVDVGLRGFTTDGVPDPRWGGRMADRNAAFAGLLFSSGLRLTEAASLLSMEVPRVGADARRYYAGRLASAVTKSKRARTFYAATPVVGEIEAYCESSRAAAVRRAQRLGRYDSLQQMRLVTSVAGRRTTVLRWRDQDGTAGETALARAGVDERAMLFAEGPEGPEPLWLWLNESGLPFRPTSWEGVFRSATERCGKVLAGSGGEAPFCTPHMCRHSFALFMLVALHHVMDVRLGLTPQERRDFRLLYGDPWRMVQDLLGHADVETTRSIYLAPVSDLQLDSLISSPAAKSEDPVGSGDVSWILSRLATETGRIQDLGHCRPVL